MEIRKAQNFFSFGITALPPADVEYIGSCSAVSSTNSWNLRVGKSALYEGCD